MPIVLGAANVSATPPPADAPTVADAERELAARTGPTASYAAVSGSTTTLARVDEVASSVQQADRAGLYAVRRGVQADGRTPVAGYDARDRVRLVASQSFVVGASGFAPDRPWTTAPATGELVELVALDPVQSLGRAVRRALGRALVEEVVVVNAAAAAVDRNLTAAAWWLTDPGQLVDVLAGSSDGVYAPRPVARWEAYRRSAYLWARIDPDPAPATLWVRALRPRSTWINGRDQSVTTVLVDGDVLSGSLDEIVSFAHDWLWDTHKDRLAPLAARGYGTPEGDVRKSAAHYRSRWPTRVDRVIGPTLFASQLEPGWGAWSGSGW